MRNLPVAQRQQVEIAKVLVADARVIILDEPTSVLAPQEVDRLFAQLGRAARQGLLDRHDHPQDPRGASASATGSRSCAAAGSIVEGAAPDSLDDAELVEAMVGRAVPVLPKPSGRGADGTVQAPA